MSFQLDTTCPAFITNAQNYTSMFQFVYNKPSSGLAQRIHEWSLLHILCMEDWDLKLLHILW